MAVEGFHLRKTGWDAADFSEMGWHDAHIHAVCFIAEGSELVFDLDYILKWVHQGATEPFNFWIAPATLVFSGVVGLHGSVGFDQGLMELPTILDINQKVAESSSLRLLQKWVYRIDFDKGQLAFHSTGFTQFFRSKPVFNVESQHLTLQDRGGISFDRPTAF